MSDQPPSPPTPTPNATSSLPTDETGEDRTLATTPQLAASIENAVGVSLEPDALETLLLELDRNGYVEWVAVSRTGDYVWDLTESPDRIADAIAEAAAARVESWVQSKLQQS